MSLSSYCKSKVKSFGERICSRENVVRLTGRYITRVVVAVVWCGVVWSLLGSSALPLQYFFDENCIVPRNVTTFENDSSLPPDSLDDTFRILSYSKSSILASFYDDTLNQYILLEIRRSRQCENISVELQMINNNWTVPASIVLDVDDIFNQEEGPGGLIDIPNGHFFALILLLIFSSICGFLAKLICLPPLFGMIIAGLILRNVPYIDFAKHIQPAWSSTIRNIALVIILIRGGLSMKPTDLKRLKHAVLILGSIPCILEGVVDGAIATVYLKMPWQWGLMLGYIIAAISPAIVVPSALSLQDNGYGKNSGELTLIVAAASIDVVISISLFGVFFGLAFSEGSLILDIFRGPIQIVIGLLYGILSGLLLWIIPSKHFKEDSKVRNLFFLLFGLGLFAVFGSRRAIIGGSNLAASGALAVLVLAFVGGQGWKQNEKDCVSRVFVLVWQLAQPFLFALIGAEIDFNAIRPSFVGQGLLIIIIGLIVRVTVSFFVTLGNKFRWPTIVFIAISWIPKATVQAAIGPLALEFAMERNNDDEVQLGQQVLTIAALAILLTAPLGSICISLLGPLLLKKNKQPSEDSTEIDGGVQKTEIEQDSKQPYYIKETTV